MATELDEFIENYQKFVIVSSTVPKPESGESPCWSF